MKLSTALAALLFIGSAAAAPTPNDECVTKKSGADDRIEYKKWCLKYPTICQGKRDTDQ